MGQSPLSISAFWETARLIQHQGYHLWSMATVARVGKLGCNLRMRKPHMITVRLSWK